MKESIEQLNAEDFSIKLIDSDGQTFTAYNFNIKKILKALALKSIMEDIGKDHSIIVCDKHLCSRWDGVNIKNLLESLP